METGKSSILGEGCSYEAGDVVIYQITNTYYQATVQIHNSVESPDNDKQKWHRLNTSELNEIIEEHKSKDFCDIDNKDERRLDCRGERKQDAMHQKNNGMLGR